MVGLGGLEPPTSPLSGARSNHLSYRPIACLNRLPKYGQSLWVAYGILPHATRALPARRRYRRGGASRDRTDDPLLAKQVLSQLSYGPIWDGDPRRGVDRTLDCRCLVWAP